jgi:hypothetical protein
VIPVVATFPLDTDVGPLAVRLRAAFTIDARDISTAAVAAFGEPHDGHRLLVAWVPDDREDEVRAMVTDGGGTLHPQPPGTRPPVDGEAHPAGSPRSAVQDATGEAAG